MLNKIIAISAVAILATGCASKPESRADYGQLPQLEDGYSRVLITAGEQQNGINLWSVHQVGPVFIDGQQVGQTADNETIAVDLHPGSYQAYCEPQDNFKTYIEKKEFSFKANKTYKLYCDMGQHGSTGFLGLGAIAPEFMHKMFLQSRPDDSESKIVSYKNI